MPRFGVVATIRVREIRGLGIVVSVGEDIVGFVEVCKWDGEVEISMLEVRLDTRLVPRCESDDVRMFHHTNNNNFNLLTTRCRAHTEASQRSLSKF